MSDKIEGFLEVGTNENGEVVVNIPPNKKKREQHKTNCAYRGNTEELCDCGIEYEHIVFSPNQARNLARLLNDKAYKAEQERRSKEQAARFAEAAKIPVDRSARQLAGGSTETEDHREINPATGQQKGYIVLTPEERAKGFVRPVRDAYIHVGLFPRMEGTVLIRPGKHGCGTLTTMSRDIAETYARDPEFYSGTFCCGCRQHRPLTEFVWEGTTEQVGS
jgi:hypothetical protein